MWRKNGGLNSESSHEQPTETSDREQQRNTAKEEPPYNELENKNDNGKQNRDEVRQAETDGEEDQFVMD